MKPGPLSLLTVLTLTISQLLIAAAFAGDDAGKSGLDFNRGYDVNTVATVTGRVVSVPRPGDGEHAFVELRSGNETLNLFVGPVPHWERNGIPLQPNDEISARGSKAQGKDGKSYLLTRTLENRTTGRQVDLRNERGEAAWNGAIMRPMHPERPSGGQRHQGGMMRGGGGMMRR
ncbi:MAG: DNA-binding protein [Deltaproteobacteria bacterium]|nr:DNA-binding protein [Deltaproteobacteria bacterium]